MLTPWTNKVTIYDFAKGMYAYANDPTGGKVLVTKAFAERDQNPEVVSGREGAR